MENEKVTSVTLLAEKNIADSVLNQVKNLQDNGGLKLPSDYCVENALKSAFLVLKETVDKDNKPALEVCSQTSIANALLNMVVSGLTPAKNQCYFIAYAKKLTFQRSYNGNVAIAKRVSGLKDIKANVIYQTDEFAFEIDVLTGKRKVIKHVQTLESIDDTKIKGAYAVKIMNDGTTDVEIMTKQEIEKAWQQGFSKGGSPAHKNFSGEMCKKTVINRACKSLINSSDDSYLADEDITEKPNSEIRNDDNNNPVLDIVHEEIKDNANKEEIGIPETAELKEEPKAKVEDVIKGEPQHTAKPERLF